MTTILVINNERLLCNLLQEVLRSRGYDVYAAHSGRDGIEVFRQRRPQITLLDLHLPDIDGIEVLKKIRKISQDAAVAILADATSNKQQWEAQKLGVTDFLTKGLSTGDLIHAVEDSLRKRAVLPSPSHNGHTILVVDDEKPICELLTEYLSGRGYRVCAVQDGPAALAFVDQKHPQLIILDLHLPGMHGVDVFRTLREKKYGGGVMMLTGSRDEKLLNAALALGPIDIIGKPFDLERVGLAVDVSVILTRLHLPARSV
ncbi:MAG: response regulator [Nitrospirae bacterium]|nr:MAG: response regulator [Nitrospirota bacterium]